MTATITDLRRVRRTAAAIATVVLLSSATGAAATSPRLLRAAVALPAIALLVAAALRAPRRTLIILLIWLAALGTTRRILLPGGGATDNDPLLLVAPVVAALLVVVAIREGAFTGRTALSTCVLVLATLMVASAVNPLQGGLAVGVAGLLFTLVPLLWFWIGRALVDNELLARILRLIGTVTVGAALYGLYQVYVGFPSWDERWIQAKGYLALHVAPGAVRPFSSFTASSEYVGILSVGVVIWALRLRRTSQMPKAAAALGILSWALAVASVRNALVIIPVALGVTFAASRGFGIGRTFLAGLAALVALGFVVTRLDPGQAGSGATSALVSRSITGLSDPFNVNVSTLPLHIDALTSGLRDGFVNPLGRGVGAVTVAADRYGESNVSTDVDPSNVAIALGIPGLLAYGGVVVLALRLAFTQARRRRDYGSLVVLGVCLVTSLQWLSGGNYALVPLPWLLLGWLDASSSEARRSPSSARLSPPVPV